MLHFHVRVPEAEVPRNLPIVSPIVPSGWREVPVGERVRTTFECFALFPKPEWRLSAYFTSEKFHNPGYSNYRAPASIGAWCRVLRQLPRKYWRKLRGEL